MKKKVEDLITQKFFKIGEKDQIYEAIQKLAEDRETMLICVVDEENRLKGIVTPMELLRAVEVQEYGVIRYPFFEGAKALHLLTSRYVQDIMSSPVAVKADDDIENAINLMLDKGFYEVPVIDEDNKVIGEINYFSIITSSIKHLKRE